MHSSIIFSAIFAAGVFAAPNTRTVAGDIAIYKRTCGTLSGSALSACQTACKLACDVGTAGIAKSACKDACDLGPLKARSEPELIADVIVARTPATSAYEVFDLHKRTCGTLSGTLLTACQDACKVTCDAATAGIAKQACEKACDLGPLKARAALPEAEPGFGQEACDAACDVTCNSTILALDQLQCLKVCKGKCS